ncbi:uncharacterized protein LOC119788495 [Cyprinodon tularosa]|uniref:uncharacterized protein LOC119788495 n=1 Tax=Cyprinodon tularosa TaxID=77115 RepID=UPI0018E2327C|nr:uncharacterized protein LOC119788495 [Cyprinodon tularosa]
MKALYFYHLSHSLVWIFLLSFQSVHAGLNTELKLLRNVFVGFLGENISIDVTIIKPSNQTGIQLECFDPYNKTIYKKAINAMKESIQLHLNLNKTGMYSCKCEEAEVKLYLRYTAYRKPPVLDKVEIIIAIFTGLLLVLSVLGSMYVFRGHWKEPSSESLDTSRKQKESREDGKETEKEEDCMDMSTAQSSSFYASLEPRTRSIYEVLDCSAANSDNKETETKTSEAELSQVGEQNAENQDEGIFESVYENF